MCSTMMFCACPCAKRPQYACDILPFLPLNIASSPDTIVLRPHSLITCALAIVFVLQGIHIGICRLLGGAGALGEQHATLSYPISICLGRSPTTASFLAFLSRWIRT